MDKYRICLYFMDFEAAFQKEKGILLKKLLKVCFMHLHE